MTGAGRAGSSRSGASGSALRVAAVDLGATSGRIMAGTVSARSLHLEEVHRFPNGGVRVRDGLFWDVLGIHREVLAGIRRVAETGPLHGIGIDSWAIDYGLLDRDGTLLGNPYSHRDARTDGVAAEVAATEPRMLAAVALHPRPGVVGGHRQQRRLEGGDSPFILGRSDLPKPNRLIPACPCQGA